MAVHVNEIHTQLSPTGSAAPTADAAAQPGAGGASGAGQPHRPGAAEEAWRRSMARVTQLRCRVAAEAFDD